MFILFLSSLLGNKAVVAGEFSFSCPGIGFFGDSRHCRVYYVCTGIGKQGSAMKCDADLVWNQDKLACEWKRNLPQDFCQKELPIERRPDSNPDLDSGAEVELFDPFLPTIKPEKWSTVKRSSVFSFSWTSPAPPTTSRLGNLTEEEGAELTDKLVKSLAEVWQKCRLLMSFAVLSLL